MDHLPLESYWTSQGAKYQTIRHWRLPVQFSPDEYQRIQNMTGVTDLSYRTKIKIEGKDAQNFLHRLLTQDIQHLSIGQGAYTAFLTATGKVLFDGNLLRFGENTFLLDAEMNLSSKILERLEKFVIADEVQVSDETPGWTHLAFAGDCKLIPKTKARAAYFFCDQDAGIFFSSPSSAHWFAQALFPNPSALNWLNQMKTIYPFGYQTAEILRIESRQLRYGVDFDADTILSETGLEKIAVSFTKGCFPGQEVIARIETYGGLKRRLVLLKYDGDQPVAKGDKIFVEDGGKKIEIGRITSASEHHAIGMIPKEFWDASKEVRVQSQRGFSTAKFVLETGP